MTGYGSLVSTAVTAALLASAITAAVSLLLAAVTLWNGRRAAKYSRTERVISEFLSTNFIAHRAATWKLAELVRDGDVTLRRVAGGFSYPTLADYYGGDRYGDLTLHEHFTVYLDWLARTGYLVERGMMDVAGLRSMMATSVSYNARFAWEVCQEVEHITRAHGGPSIAKCDHVQIALRTILGDVTLLPEAVSYPDAAAASPVVGTSPRIGWWKRFGARSS